MRTNLDFPGNEAPQLSVRIRMNTTGDTALDLYWGNWTQNTFTSGRRVRVNYNGNGAFQGLVFPMTGVPGWAGKRITRLRGNSVNGTAYSGSVFEINSVSVPLTTGATRRTGLRFSDPQSDALNGNGSLEIAPRSGPLTVSKSIITGNVANDGWRAKITPLSWSSTSVSARLMSAARGAITGLWDRNPSRTPMHADYDPFGVRLRSHYLDNNGCRIARQLGTPSACV